MESPPLPFRDIEISAARKADEEGRRGDRGRSEGVKTSVMAKGGARDAAPSPTPPRPRPPWPPSPTFASIHVTYESRARIPST